MIDDTVRMTPEQRAWHDGYRDAVFNFGSVFLKGYVAGAISALIISWRWWT